MEAYPRNFGGKRTLPGFFFFFFPIFCACVFFLQNTFQPSSQGMERDGELACPSVGCGARAARSKVVGAGFANRREPP